MIHKFVGTGTALVTPFLTDGSIDFPALYRLLDFQIDNGIEYIVIGGSTGESATMSFAEKQLLFQKSIDYVAGRRPIIAGTGSNDTRATIELTKVAVDAGADGVLLVSPFYNKPTQNGLIQHFSAIAQSADTSFILYNVPGRTASNMLPETQLAIAEANKNVIATKEASADLEQMMEIIRSAPSHFTLLAGDDSLTLPIIASGGTGTISVISNYAPKQFGDLVRASIAGDFSKAREILYKLLPLMKANFIESNPIPVKAALQLMGMIGSTIRLPLTPATESTITSMKKALQDAHIL
ncbi:MAG: 4-hydroxy-tetrahydrodipicolinate synthase [Candidatus Kapabacteria bacterium]|nr:4-hydroxy-tetrahydrodipicolinate synthase [Candidatus Kapabacteria bacterium]